MYISYSESTLITSFGDRAFATESSVSLTLKGTESKSTTMIYTHVLNREPHGVVSPTDAI